MSRRELEERIRFALHQLGVRNAHHEFEHICRRIARLRICSNILPATGPVTSGGDQGRDFESFRTYLRDNLTETSTFAGLAADIPIVFACTVQQTSIATKIQNDLASIAAGARCDSVHYFLTADLPVARRHELQQAAKDGHGLHLEVYDGAAITEFLADADLFWIANEYLTIPADAYLDCGPFPFNVLETRFTRLPGREVPSSMLLAAPFAVVPWHSAGRTEVMATLDAWADDTTQPVAVRLLHAPGGAGKTRLAMEWLRRRRDRGDTAGFLKRAAEPGWLTGVCQPGAPVVVAIDYAETRSDLLAVLGAVATLAAAPEPPHVRVLLLARGDGDWWGALMARELAIKALLIAQAPIALRPLVMGAVERQVVFHEALVTFAEHRRLPVPRAQISADDPHFDRVLYLHMAALAAVERAATPRSAASTEVAVLDAGKLMDEILDHEQRFWVRDPQDPDSAVIPLARQIVAAATLRGRIARVAEGQALFKRLSGRERTNADDQLLALLHDVYAVDEDDPYLPGLQPDLLGEAMVLRVAKQQKDEQWIERVIVEADDTDIVSNAFTVLGRAAATGPTAIRPWIETLLRTSFLTRAVPALRAAKAVGQRTAFSILGDLLANQLEWNGSASLMAELAREGISYPTVSLRRVAEYLFRMGLEHVAAVENAFFHEEYASLLLAHGLWLGELGQHEAALAITRRAVDLYGALVARDRDVFLPGFARSLNDLGTRLAKLGQSELALAAAREAVDLRRELVAKNFDVFSLEFVRSLNNLGNAQSVLGQHEPALATLREAVDICRSLKNPAPVALQLLARSLNHMGLTLSELGRYQPAFAATREAVGICRELVDQDQDAFLPDLAMVLDSLDSLRLELAPCETTLRDTREALEIHRGLAALDDAFLPDLAGSFHNLGARLLRLGQREAALDALREAVGIYRPLVAKTPDAFLPNLANSLNTLGCSLIGLGQYEPALVAMREAVEIYRPLVARTRDAFLPDLASRLDNLGRILSELVQHEPALAATREAVDLYRELAAKAPDVFGPSLAISLNTLGARHAALGQREPQLAVLREAVDLCHTLSARDPDTFRPYLAMSLQNLGLTLSAMNQFESALAARREAVDVYRALAVQNRIRYEPDLARSLHDLGNLLSALGQRELALDAAREESDLRRVLAARNPGELPKLAISLHQLVISLSELGQRESALAAIREAVDVYRALAAPKNETFQRELAFSLYLMSAALRELNQYGPALAATREAVDLYRTVAAPNPEAFEPMLAVNLNDLSIILSKLDQHELALTAAHEAVDLYRRLAIRDRDAFRVNLEESLSHLQDRLIELDHHEPALAIACELVELCRGLAADDPDAFQSKLADRLDLLGMMSGILGQQEPACAAAREALDERRRFAIRNPESGLPALAASIDNLGNRICELDQPRAVLTRNLVELYCAQIQLYCTLTAHSPDAFLVGVKTSLRDLSLRLSNLNQHDSALALARELVELCRALAVEAPDAFLFDLASSLNSLGIRLSAAGQCVPALAAAQEAVDHFRALAARDPDAFFPDLATSLENLAFLLTEIGDPHAADATSHEAADIRRTLQAKPYPDDE